MYFLLKRGSGIEFLPRLKFSGIEKEKFVMGVTQRTRHGAYRAAAKFCLEAKSQLPPGLTATLMGWRLGRVRAAELKMRPIRCGD
jgi:hypothetical protein